jgi:hypothetical protein
MSNEFQFYFGLDLGQIQDFSAAVVAEKQESEFHHLSHRPTKVPRVYYIRSAHRFDLRTPYTTIVQEVTKVLSQPSLAGKTALLIDATGVGRAVTDIFKAAPLSAPLYEVTITAGEHVSRERDAFHVPKRDLAAAVQVAFEQELIKIAQGLPFEDILKQELKNFKVKINAKTAHDSYEAWREGEHDDLVLATALALWGGGQKLKRSKMFEGLTTAPAPAPRVQVRKINETYEEIILTHPSQEEYKKKAEQGWKWNDILYGGRQV